MVVGADELMPVREAARRLHLSPSTIWRWIDSGRLPAVRAGARRVLIRQSDLAAVLLPAREPKADHPRMSAEEQARWKEALADFMAARAKLLATDWGKDTRSVLDDLDEARAIRTAELS